VEDLVRRAEVIKATWVAALRNTRGVHDGSGDVHGPHGEEVPEPLQDLIVKEELRTEEPAAATVGERGSRQGVMTASGRMNSEYS